MLHYIKNIYRIAQNFGGEKILVNFTKLHWFDKIFPLKLLRAAVTNFSALILLFHWTWGWELYYSNPPCSKATE